MINCYIISDTITFQTLKTYIERLPLAKIIHHSLPDCVDIHSIATSDASLVFVDFACLKTHRSTLLHIAQSTAIVYLSKTDHDAYEAYETLGFDFLTLPLGLERFEKTINKFISLSLVAQLSNTKRDDIITDSFFIKSDSKGQKEVLIKCKDVLFIEALQNYVVICMVNDVKFICHNTMKEMEENLPGNIFIRVHKSFIINYEKVTSIEGNNVILNENEKILIGNTYRRTFLARKNQMMIKKKNYLHAYDFPRNVSACLIGGIITQFFELMEGIGFGWV